jgi:hypothetical protein
MERAQLKANLKYTSDSLPHVFGSIVNSLKLAFGLPIVDSHRDPGRFPQAD